MHIHVGTYEKYSFGGKYVHVSVESNRHHVKYCLLSFALGSFFCYAVLCVISPFAIKTELNALL